MMLVRFSPIRSRNNLDGRGHTDLADLAAMMLAVHRTLRPVRSGRPHDLAAMMLAVHRTLRPVRSGRPHDLAAMMLAVHRTLRPVRSGRPHDLAAMMLPSPHRHQWIWPTVSHTDLADLAAMMLVADLHHSDTSGSSPTSTSPR